MRQRSRPAIPHNAAVVENLLELGSSFLALTRGKVRLAANVGGIEAGEIANECNYITKKEFEKLDADYERIIGQIVIMIDGADDWLIR